MSCCTLLQTDLLVTISAEELKHGAKMQTRRLITEDAMHLADELATENRVRCIYRRGGVNGTQLGMVRCHHGQKDRRWGKVDGGRRGHTW